MADGVVDSRAAPNRWRSRVRDGAAASASIPPASAAGHFVVGPSVATEAAALEDDLSPAWWTHRPASGAAIGEPFEHDSRTASGAGGRPAGGSPGVRPRTRAVAAPTKPSGMHPAHTGHRSRPLLDTPRAARRGRRPDAGARPRAITPPAPPLPAARAVRAATPRPPSWARDARIARPTAAARRLIMARTHPVPSTVAPSASPPLASSSPPAVELRVEPRACRRGRLPRRPPPASPRTIDRSPRSWPARRGGRTVRPPLAREAWSTGAEVAGAPWQTRPSAPREPGPALTAEAAEVDCAAAGLAAELSLG